MLILIQILLIDNDPVAGGKNPERYREIILI